MIEESSESERISQLNWVAERDPDRALALLAAPAAVRESLTLLFALDLRLAAVADRIGEPAAALLRLAWWRDALTALDAAIPAEPMLQAVSKLLISRGISGATLARIAEGWPALAEDEALPPPAIDEHGAERGGALFTIAGHLCGADDARLAAAGAAWALADRAAHARDPALAARLAEAARTGFDKLGNAAWPRRLRVLGTLVALARQDLGPKGPRSRLVRLLRALRHRLTGR